MSRLSEYSCLKVLFIIAILFLPLVPPYVHAQAGEVLTTKTITPDFVMPNETMEVKIKIEVTGDPVGSATGGRWDPDTGSPGNTPPRARGFQPIGPDPYAHVHRPGLRRSRHLGGSGSGRRTGGVSGGRSQPEQVHGRRTF